MKNSFSFYCFPFQTSLLANSSNKHYYTNIFYVIYPLSCDLLKTSPGALTLLGGPSIAFGKRINARSAYAESSSVNVRYYDVPDGLLWRKLVKYASRLCPVRFLGGWQWRIAFGNVHWFWRFEYSIGTGHWSTAFPVQVCLIKFR